MNYRQLGSTELQVASLCLGTMTFGDGADEKVCRDLYALSRDRGVNLFDCANVYADGESERILGRLVDGHRSDVLIATKAYYPMHSDPDTQGLGNSSLRKALEGSLLRLNTDYVDLFYLHCFDEQTPLAETLTTLDEFVRQGKIRHVGVSNFAAWQVMKALSVAELGNLPTVAVIQPMYNLLKRQCESELLPMATAERLGVLSYGPVAGGFLTGKYLNSKSAAGRFSSSEMYKKRYGQDSDQTAVAGFLTLADEFNVQPASLAIAWVASNPAVSAPIVGARSIDQLKTALDSIEIDMTGDLRQLISDLTPTPPLATDRAEEQE